MSRGPTGLWAQTRSNDLVIPEFLFLAAPGTITGGQQRTREKEGVLSCPLCTELSSLPAGEGAFPPGPTPPGLPQAPGHTMLDIWLTHAAGTPHSTSVLKSVAQKYHCLCLDPIKYFKETASSVLNDPFSP